MPERNDCLVPGPLGQAAILGVVLAGGASSRFGRNKAVARLGNVRLIDRVVARAKVQTARVIISGHCPGMVDIEMIPDAGEGEGPLTGVLSALRWAQHKGYAAIATFPCDVPFFPADLVARLFVAAGKDSIGAFACCRGQRHAAFALWPLAALERIGEAYAAGERSLMGVQDRIGAVAVDFSPDDGPQGNPFFNINRQSDLAVAEMWLRGRR